VITGERGDYRLARPYESAQVPATVQAVLAARIDRLDPADKRLLQAAAVVGKDVPYPLLQAIAELPDAALAAGLARLQAGEFLYETRLFPDLEYTFKHALTHEVTYGSLVQERRRALHLWTLEALEALSPEQRAERIELLAHHAYRGEAWDRAAAYSEQAGRRAAGRSAHRAAAAHVEQALDALRRLPQQATSPGRQIDLYIALRNALQPLADFPRLHEALQAAQSLAEAHDDRPRLGRVLAHLCAYHAHIGECAPAVAYGERALALGKALDDVPLQIMANYQLGGAYWIQNPGRGIAPLRRNLLLFANHRPDERFGLAVPAAPMGRGLLAAALAACGEFAEARAHAEEAFRLAVEIDHPQSMSATCFRLADVHREQGLFDRAIPLLERGLAIAQTWEIRVWYLINAAALSIVQARTGRQVEALATLEPISAQLHAGVIPIYYGLAFMGESYWLAGRGDQGKALADEALAWAQSQQDRAHEGRLLRLLGDIATAAEPCISSEAESHYRQALSIAEELGLRPLVAHCHLGLGMLYQKLGREAQAQAELGTAAEMYRTMEMTYWLARAEAELGRIASAP
jgi:tetratricopeptide (TPR) repeat protein